MIFSLLPLINICVGGAKKTTAFFSFGKFHETKKGAILRQEENNFCGKIDY